MRFSGLEGQCLGAYLLSFDDSSATNRLGAMEHQRTKYELFWAKTILIKSLWHILHKTNLQSVFTILSAVVSRIRGIKEYIGNLLIKILRAFR